MEEVSADRPQLQFSFRIASGVTQDPHPGGLRCANPRQESSTTTQRDGCTRNVCAACRNRPGSGFHDPTSYALKMRPSKWLSSFVNPSACVSFDIGPFDATQTGTVISASAAWIPSTGFSPASNANAVARLISATKSARTLRPDRRSISRTQSAIFTPRKSRVASSTPIAAPSSVAARAKTVSAIFSLSTKTPSESKIMSSITTNPHREQSVPSTTTNRDFDSTKPS